MSQDKTLLQDCLLQIFPSCLAFTIDQYCDSLCNICNHSFPKSFQCIKCKKTKTKLICMDECFDDVIITENIVNWQTNEHHDVWTYLHEIYFMSNYNIQHKVMRKGYFLITIEDNILSLCMHDGYSGFNPILEFFA